MRIINFALSFLILCPVVLLAQENISKRKQKKILKKARYHFNTASYYKAAVFYQKLIDADNQNKLYQYETGLAWYYTNFERLKSEKYLLASQSVSNGDTIPETFFFLAEVYHLKGEFERAIKSYERYRAIVEAKGIVRSKDIAGPIKKELEQKIGWCRTGILYRDSVIHRFLFKGDQKDTSFVLGELDSTVNSRFDDYCSILNANDSLLYFTSRRGEGDKAYIDYFDVKYMEDIFISTKTMGTWTKARLLPGEVNTAKRHEATNSLSVDGKKLYLYRGVRTGTIYESQLKKNSWSKPKKLNGTSLNTKHWETSLAFTISNDSIMYVVSDRPGGYGGRDIYQCKKQKDGTWGSLENLGPFINTIYEEDGPYLSDDGNTLYFSSNSTASLGGFDLFKSERINGKWSKPRNLGLPFNSTANDVYFHFANKDRLALISSSRLHNGFSDMQLWSITPKPPEKNDVLVVMDTTKLVPPLVPPLITDSVPSFSIKSDSLIIIYFGFEKEVFGSGYQNELDKIAARIIANPNSKIELSGHTDSKGSRRTNERISLRRSETVQQYLISKGVSPSKIKIDFYGEDQPVETNLSEKGRQLNRRVEIKIVGN